MLHLSPCESDNVSKRFLIVNGSIKPIMPLEPSFDGVVPICHSLAASKEFEPPGVVA
jgi:hypothetical protein